MLIFGDTFDHYLNPRHKYEVVTSGVAIVGGLHDKGLQLGAEGYVRKLVRGESSTWILGCAVLTSGYGDLLAFRGAAAEIVRVSCDSNRALVVRVAGEIAGTSSAGVLVDATWQYLEVKYAPGDQVVVRVDGTVALTVSPLTALGVPVWLQIGGTAAVTVDDLYLCDASGATNNDFIGRVRGKALRVTGQTSITNVGATHPTSLPYLLVDDEVPDEDATYLALDTLATEAGEIDVTGSGARSGVVGIGVSVMARNDQLTKVPEVRAGVGDSEVVGNAVVLGGCPVETNYSVVPGNYLSVERFMDRTPGGQVFDGVEWSANVDLVWSTAPFRMCGVRLSGLYLLVSGRDRSPTYAHLYRQRVLLVCRRDAIA